MTAAMWTWIKKSFCRHTMGGVVSRRWTVELCRVVIPFEGGGPPTLAIDECAKCGKLRVRNVDNPISEAEG